MRDERNWETSGVAACEGSGVALDNSRLFGSYVALHLVLA